MSRSDNAGLYFQTSDALATSERKAKKAKNRHGSPITLSSKILAVESDPFKDRAVYVVEAVGEVKSLDVDTGEIKKLGIQAKAPLTSLTVCLKDQTLFAGCWDQQIYRASLTTSSTSSTTPQFTRGHTDFVKCLLATTIDNRPILLSGAADATIIVWDLQTFQPIHKLKGHTKALQAFAIDPLSLPAGASEPQDSFVLFSASSDREIRRWRISLAAAAELPESVGHPILAHDTSVYRLRFDSDGDLWTASADKTAKHLVRARDFASDTTLLHPDFVRDVVVSERLGLVVTACRDEEVRVWDAASGDLICVYSGHYEEVTGLALVEDGRKVISVSIDGTVRQWGLERGEMTKYVEDLKREQEGDDAANASAGVGGDAGNTLTAEEEAELAELMEEDDD